LKPRASAGAANETSKMPVRIAVARDFMVRGTHSNP
jgi:hypothetical protein